MEGDRKDVTPKHLLARGVRIVRVETVAHFARSGNLHHPTPRYRWEAFQGRTFLGSSYTLRGVKEIAAQDTK